MHVLYFLKYLTTMPTYFTLITYTSSQFYDEEPIAIQVEAGINVLQWCRGVIDSHG